MVQLYGFFGYESIEDFSFFTVKMVVFTLSHCELFPYQVNHYFNLILNRT